MDHREVIRRSMRAVSTVGAPALIILALAIPALGACSSVPPAPVVAPPTVVSPTQPAPAAAVAAPSASASPPPPAPATAAPAQAAPKAAPQAAASVDLKEELFLAGAPSFAMIPRCPMPVNFSAGQRAATWTSTYDSGMLCLFGFGDNETVRYEVRDAAGEIAKSGEGAPDNLDGDALPSVKVMLTIGDRAPGVWEVAASGAGGELSARFTAEPQTLEGKPAIVLAIEAGQTAFKPGDAVHVAVYGLAEGSAPPFGVYQVTSKINRGAQLKLHEGAALEPDAGAAFLTVTLDPTYTAGEYCLIVQAGAEYRPAQGLSDQGAARCFEVTP